MRRRNTFTPPFVQVGLLGLLVSLLSAHDPTAVAQEAGQGPGPELRRMQPMVGLWGIQTKFHKIPSSPNEGSGKGTITFRWTLNGFFLSCDYHSTSNRGPYAGHCMFTYDDAAGVYRYWWFDSRGGGQEFTGHWDERAKSFVLTASGLDHNGTKVKKRLSYRLVNENQIEFRLEYGYPEKGFIPYITSTYRKNL